MLAYAHKNTSSSSTNFINEMCTIRDYNVSHLIVVVVHVTMSELFRTLRSKIDNSVVIENVELFDIRQVVFRITCKC